MVGAILGRLLTAWSAARDRRTVDRQLSVRRPACAASSPGTCMRHDLVHSLRTAGTWIPVQPACASGGGKALMTDAQLERRKQPDPGKLIPSVHAFAYRSLRFRRADSAVDWVALLFIVAAVGGPLAPERTTRSESA